MDFSIRRRERESVGRQNWLLSSHEVLGPLNPDRDKKSRHVRGERWEDPQLTSRSRAGAPLRALISVGSVAPELCVKPAWRAD